MTLTFPMINLSNLKRALCAIIAKLASPTAHVNSGGDNALAERAFIRELMFNNPEGIQSDLGLMEMMTQYPRHF
jgi:hypothetical protein